MIENKIRTFTYFAYVELYIFVLSSLFNEAIDLGAKGFVLKDSALTDIIDCIKVVAGNHYYASHALTSFLINRSQRNFGLAEK